MKSTPVIPAPPGSPRAAPATRATMPVAPRSATLPVLRAGPALAPDAFAAIRRRLVLEFCKWDPQVGDVATLAPFPLILHRGAWRDLRRAAEQLARETLDAEHALLRRPDLHARLGVP